LPVDILRIVLGRGVALTLTGLSIGLLTAFALARLMSTLVYGISLADPLTFVTGAAVLLLVSLLAGYLPARRAMRLDPVDVLRSE
jgi:ABC-type antimicrobial peptide transport system permease subunit